MSRAFIHISGRKEQAQEDVDFEKKEATQLMSTESNSMENVLQQQAKIATELLIDKVNLLLLEFVLIFFFHALSL